MINNKKCILVIDQGTTSSRAIIFDYKGKVLFQKSIEISQIYPKDGWVEQSPKEIWKSVLEVVKNVIKKAIKKGKSITSVSITNQRETTIVWDRKTGIPIYNAIGWQDRRTSDRCRMLSSKKNIKLIHKKTGLLLDPYFSASKISWILDNIQGARNKANKGELCFGTIDTFLLFKFTNGNSFSTDVTNASRTSLFDIIALKWDMQLCKLFDVPKAILPKVYDCISFFGEINKSFFGINIPILSIIGDQQASSIGQSCTNIGDLKSTYGTGCFILVNTGGEIVYSKNRLISTIAYKINKKTAYALEGSIFTSGSAIKWLRDKLNLLEDASESEAIAKKLKDNKGVYFVPALSGLGAPYWRPNARGAIYGLSLDSGSEEIIRAALESIAYQTADLIKALKADGIHIKKIRVDGGMVSNKWFLQFLSNILDLPIEKPIFSETTSLGAAVLSLIAIGYFKDISDAQKICKIDKVFCPNMREEKRKKLIRGWEVAVNRTISNF